MIQEGVPRDLKQGGRFNERPNPVDFKSEFKAVGLFSHAGRRVSVSNDKQLSSVKPDLFRFDSRRADFFDLPKKPKPPGVRAPTSRAELSSLPQPSTLIGKALAAPSVSGSSKSMGHLFRSGVRVHGARPDPEDEPLSPQRSVMEAGRAEGASAGLGPIDESGFFASERIVAGLRTGADAASYFLAMASHRLPVKFVHLIVADAGYSGYSPYELMVCPEPTASSAPEHFVMTATAVTWVSGKQFQAQPLAEWLREKDIWALLRRRSSPCHLPFSWFSEVQPPHPDAQNLAGSLSSRSIC